jgi:hypothetical protein
MVNLVVEELAAQKGGPAPRLLLDGCATKAESRHDETTLWVYSTRRVGAWKMEMLAPEVAAGRSQKRHPIDNVTPLIIIQGIKSPTPTHTHTHSFPRTIPQAEALEKHLKIDVVVNLDIPDQTIIERISNRWIHAASGRTYAYDYNPPKKHGVDDVTGACGLVGIGMGGYGRACLPAKAGGERG